MPASTDARSAPSSRSDSTTSPVSALIPKKSMDGKWLPSIQFKFDFITAQQRTAKSSLIFGFLSLSTKLNFACPSESS
jgi:hypothetical protein